MSARAPSPPPTPRAFRVRLGVAVRPAAPCDVPAAAAVLARAFRDDPVTGFLLGDGGRRPGALEDFFALQLLRSYLPHGGVSLATLPGDQVVGALLALGPESVGSLGAEVGFALQLAQLLRTRYVPARRLGHALGRRRPPVPHLYIGTIGVEPTLWRRGIGAALLAPVLAAADREGRPAYLECSRAENLSFYTRLGFSCTEVLERVRTPPLWLMTRPARR